MNLDRISIEPRQRNQWEAIDLGFIMARKWFLPLFLGWLIPMITIALITIIFLYDYLWIAGLIIWWLKPLFDRIPLFIASHALFGEKITLAQAIQNIPSLWRIDLLPWLTWRRLNATRSFDMPITLLEHLKGKRRQQRLKILQYRNTGAAMWLTLVCVHMEMLIIFGALALAALLLPSEANINVAELIMEESTLNDWVSFLLSLLAMALIAPFYTMAGFALYISRRIELEAWDVEIRFRHLAKKHYKGTGIQASALITIIALFLLFQPISVFADLTNNVEQYSVPQQEKTNVFIENERQSKNLIQEILAGDDFHLRKDVTHWRLKGEESSDESEDRLPEWLIQLVEIFEHLLKGESETKKHDPVKIAWLLEALLWIVALSLIIYVVYRYRVSISRILNIKTRTVKQTPKAEILFGLDVRQDSLPLNIPDQVMLLCANNDFRQALSLLYRATLSNLMHQHDLTFYDSHTEGECVVIVQGIGDLILSQFAHDLTLRWQGLAYGHMRPDQADIQLLCDRWKRIFNNEK
jgi:hypothetical protein